MPENPQPCTIHTIETNWLGLPRYTAVYLLEGPEGLALIETGAYSSNDHVVAGLKRLGFEPSDVGDVLVSHIHLDHAGAAWWWARQGAQIHAHEFGAKHLVSPDVLLKSATRIYGERMDELWGDVEPIDEAKMTPVHGGDILEIAGLRIEAIETPGHARHHHAYALATEAHGRVCFSGDAAGMIMPEGHYIAVPTPPPEFDFEVWIETLRRLEERRFDALFPTHFGKYDREPNHHFEALAEALQAHVGFVGGLMQQGAERDEVYEKLVAWQRDVALELGTPERLYRDYTVEHLMDMNVTGLMRYWAKKHEADAPPAPSA